MSEPTARDTERTLLSALLFTKTARTEARRHLTGRDFDDPRHEAIWDAMSNLDRHKRNVDAAILNEVLHGTPAQAALLDVITANGIPDNVPEYAAIVRGYSTKRRLEVEARSVLHEVDKPGVNPAGFAATVANRFAAIRDSGNTVDDVTAVTVNELLEQEDDEPEWLIPNLLEKRDRFMLTGEEGLGKSHLLRQFAIHAAAGLNPFDMAQTFTPIRTLLIDCENSWSQVRRKVRPGAEWAARHGSDPGQNMMVDCISRIDIRRDRDLSHIHQLLDAQRPDLVVIGPLYRLVPIAIQSDDDAAPVLAALDTIRERGCALLMEAHAGHAIGKGGVRDLRPRGSSALLGWPEFGFGMRGIGTEGYADLVPWRGQREERDFPTRLRKADGFRWLPHHDMYGYNQGGAA